MATVIERGKYHKTELLSDGRMQATIGQLPIHYRDDSGAWQTINTDWSSVGGARPNAITSASVMVSVGDDGLRRIHPNRDVNKYIEIGAPYIKPAATWNKVALGTPTRSGNLLTWVTANANAYCWHGGHYVKLGFLLKGGWLPPNSQFAFPVGINGLTRPGSTILDNGVPVMVIDKPVVYDLDNQRDRRDITFSFTSVTISGQSQPILLMTLPDLTGMSRPLVDPTLTLQPDNSAGKDALGYEGTPTTNYDYGSITAGAEGGVGDRCDSGIQFDLSSLPSTAVISSATLTMIIDYTSGAGALTVEVRRLKRSWTETGWTWNKYDGTNSWQTAGAYGANDVETAAIGSTSVPASGTAPIGTSISWSLTPTTKADLDLGNGWLIRSTVETSNRRDFRTSNNGTASNRPVLVIVYTVAATVSGAITPAGSLIKQAGKLLTGVITSAGALLRQTNKVLSGSLSPSGSLSKTAQKLASGIVTSAGSLSNQVSKFFAGLVTSAGTLTQQASKLFEGAVNSSGTLTRSVSKILDGVVDAAGSLTVLAQKVLAGAITASGDLIKLPSKVLAGSLSFAGDLLTARQLSPAGLITPIGSLTKQARKLLEGSLSAVGTLLRVSNKMLSGAVSFVGSLVTIKHKILSGTVTCSGTLTFLLIVSIPGVVTTIITRPYSVSVEKHEAFVLSADLFEAFEQVMVTDERYALTTELHSAFSANIQELPV